MIMWRKGYPRAVYQPVVIIHGVAYTVADEVVFKRHECEWILPSSVAKHLKYNPRHLPVVQYTTDWYLTDAVWCVVIERWYADEDTEIVAIWREQCSSRK